LSIIYNIIRIRQIEMSNPLIVLPRPGAAKPNGTTQSISAPSEDAFVAAFGKLLPPASFLSTEHGRAAYYEIQPTSAPPSDYKSPISRVLFVHGIQTPALGLQPLASVLSSRFPCAKVVLVDLWGHGLTDTPAVAHEPAIFHALLEAVMVRLGWEDAHFVGFSFGGSTTATFTAAKPERVASIVLVAPVGLMRTSGFNELEKDYLRGGEGVEEQARAWVLEKLQGSRPILPPDWKERIGRGEIVAGVIREWALREHRGHAASVVAIYRDGGVFDKHAEFANVAKSGIKTLCILGELDDVCSVEDLHQIGMANVVIVPQVGHEVVRVRVPEVAGAIEDFWNTL
jgi:pimeloyl-ACP methyl ester carboxylesterase